MERRAITIQGVVQGVGFRPFVYGLARKLHLKGFVRNQMGAVLIEVEGSVPRLDEFLSELTHRPPPLAQIDALSWRGCAWRGDCEFRIECSVEEEETHGEVFISPDVATCEQCLAELFDPHDRRYRYPFLNCTNCGPRLTIIRGVPYDRARTTMASFPMCSACQKEYEDPLDRRFHAQPTACPTCGPQLQVHDDRGRRIEALDPLSFFVQALQAQQIGALKGLGGFHLVCDAHEAQAVARLRQRKQRDEKPFAIMVADVAAAATLCEMSAAERALLSLRRGRSCCCARR